MSKYFYINILNKKGHEMTIIFLVTVGSPVVCLLTMARDSI